MLVLTIFIVYSIWCFFAWTRYQNNGSIELYHIECCVDPNFHWSSQEDYHLFNIINESTKANDIGSIINLHNNDRESSMTENHSALNANIK